jgi:hypothetical protein
MSQILPKKKWGHALVGIAATYFAGKIYPAAA